MYHQTLSTIIATIAITTATKDNTPEKIAASKLPSFIFSISNDAIRNILANTHRTNAIINPNGSSIALLHTPYTIADAHKYKIHLHNAKMPITANRIKLNVARMSLTSFALMNRRFLKRKKSFLI